MVLSCQSEFNNGTPFVNVGIDLIFHSLIGVKELMHMGVYM